MSWDEVDANREMAMLCFERDAIEPFEQRMFRVWMSINEVLNFHLGTRFSKFEDCIPAALLYNPFDATGPIWNGAGKAYGSKRVREAVELLTDAAVEIEDQLSRSNSEITIETRGRLFRRIEQFSGPIWWQLREFVAHDDRLLLEAIIVLREHFEECLSNPERSKGNYQAFRMAVALRAIFEVHTSLNITSGDWGYRTDEGWVAFASGPFCNCLKSLYDLVDVKAGYRHYASKAQDLVDDHPLLKSYKNDLLNAPAVVRRKLEFSSFTD